MQIINFIVSCVLLSGSVFSIPHNLEDSKRLLQATCPIAACPAYALNNYSKKTRCSGGCILEYNLGGSIATCNSALSLRLTSKPITC